MLALLPGVLFRRARARRSGAEWDRMLERFRALLRLFFGRSVWGRATIVAASGLIAVALLGGTADAAPNASIVVDHKTGKVLYSSNADSQRYPASLTKMMTLYMLFEAIESGKTGLDSKIKMSAFAASQPPSKLGIKAGGTITVRDAILALVTKSANDVATAIAEHLAGTEKAFAQAMTNRARHLGMTRTTFRNAHGLPNTAQVTTARDMATLGRALQDHFPQYFSYFSTRSFAWKGSRMGNHNRLLGRVDGVTGIKTGYTRASGFNLVTSVDRGGRQIVAVVIGGDTGKQRDNKMAGLIETYLPKASRGQRTTPLIARGPGIPMTSAANIRVALAAYPMPRLRPTTAVVAAASAPIPLAPPAGLEVAETTASTELPETAAAFASASVAQIIGANSIFALEAIDELEQQGDAGATDEEIADDAPAPATAKSGWKIQIAATPTQNSAEELLQAARAKAPTVLADVSPYTEPVQAGNATLYRARFGGFASKETARDACAYLTRKNFNCLAISN
jgi:D-alanyl-D-alanine carboxypeptidase